MTTTAAMIQTQVPFLIAMGRSQSQRPEKMLCMAAPLIAMPAYRLAPGRVSLWGETPAVALPAPYVEAVTRAGGHPILLSSLDPGPAEELLAPFDALLLAGGGDIDPAAYGQEQRAEVYGMDPNRDRLEMDLVRAALRQGKPALCVCRGMQVANVASTGSATGWSRRGGVPTGWSRASSSRIRATSGCSGCNGTRRRLRPTIPHSRRCSLPW
jgi:hypothetical protein